MSVHPFRPLPVVREPVVLVEAAACQWCRWADVARPHQCSHPVRGGPSRPFCLGLNPRGECPHFSPSWWTRVGRALRLWRAPALVDPRVWDREG